MNDCDARSFESVCGGWHFWLSDVVDHACAGAELVGLDSHLVKHPHVEVRDRFLWEGFRNIAINMDHSHG